MRPIFLFFFILFFLIEAYSLPNTINIASGTPLPLTPEFLRTYGFTVEKNTGGWGDVMANVKMALDLKKRYPQIAVRLIVTLNEDEHLHNSETGKVGQFIPEVLRSNSGEKYLDIHSKVIQHYEGIEVYFVDLASSLIHSTNSSLSEEQIQTIKQATNHIPAAELGLVFSDAPTHGVNSDILKAEKMEIHFAEYNSENSSLPNLGVVKFAFLNLPVSYFRMRSGLSGMGFYGLNSVNPAKSTLENQAVISKWLGTIQSKYPELKNHVSYSSFQNLAFAYAGSGYGNNSIVTDYVRAVSEITQGKTLIVFNGTGEPFIRKTETGELVYIPLGQHPMELAHALIAESKLSPLVTGDSSLSSALATTTKKKSFLYEDIPWKKRIDH